MPWTTTHPSLLRRLRDPNDEAAWHRFDRLYGGLIVAYACRRGLDLSDAEDLRQNVLLALVRAFPQFEFRPERGRFRSYLGRVVSRAVDRHERRPHRRRERVSGDDGFFDRFAAPSDLDELWEREWQDHHLRRALAFVRTTTDAATVVLFQRLLDGESVAELAAAHGVSEEAVYKMKQRMRDRLRRRIADQVAAEEDGYA